MPKILITDELREDLTFEYSRNTVLKDSKEMREFNVKSFNGLLRDGLKYDKTERKVCLYETLKGEKIYIQYPGKESEERKKIMPLDFRPELQMCNGEYITAASFEDIWDILDEIGREQKKELPYVASIFLRLGYMYDYKKEKRLYKYVDEDIKNKKIINDGKLELEWYSLDLSDDIWFTLNDRIGQLNFRENEFVSFEAFIKFVDLLFQNEDCKYYYKNVILDGKTNYNFSNGRTQSSEANLLIINHLEEKTKLSDLLNAFQKSRGVPNFKKTDYSIVTNGIVMNIDVI